MMTVRCFRYTQFWVWCSSFFGSLFAVFAATDREEYRLRDGLLTVLIASAVALAGLWLMLAAAAAVSDRLFGTTYSAMVHRYGNC